MPIGPFRTYSQPVNVGELERRFEAGADVTPEALKAAGLIGKVSVDVKILGQGELQTKLSVAAHAFSKSAVAKIEAAGGTVTWLRGEPVERKRKRHKATVRALGLRKMHQTVEHVETPALRGMLYMVNHLVKVEEV
jgi:ribosomal protein L30